MPIYCDESGYTGVNLLVEEQPYFVYSALNISEKDASDFQKYLKQTYRLQGEIKGANLIKSASGRRAITALFNKYADRVKIVYHHKKYALACKFFEYVFEPVIASKNSFFYTYKFNRFISNLMYAAFKDKPDNAESVFLKFQELLRGNDFAGLFNIFNSSKSPYELVEHIAQFTIIHKATILNEIQTDGKVDVWVLDLTQSALYDLLCRWGIDQDLTVICDVSKPLKETVERYSDLYGVNQKKIFWTPFGDEELPLNFTLAEPLKFKTSKDCPGLQLADLFATSVFWALKNPDDAFGKFIFGHLEGIIRRSGNNCIMPQPAIYLQPGSMEFAFGIVTLQKLAKFSMQDKDRVLDLYHEDLINKVETFNKKIKRQK